MATISAPNKSFNGVRAGVTFVDGVGATSNVNALNFLTRRGYTIDVGEGLDDLPSTLELEVVQDPVDMTRAELVMFAAQEGIDLDGATLKADILAVIMLAGAPAAPVGTAGDAQVSVAYAAPAWTGTSSITGYKIRVYADGALVGAPLPDTASPLVVTGLDNDTPYTFTVAAVNGAGEGPESPHSAAATPTDA